MALLTGDDIANQNFKTVINVKGYDRDEVDFVLDEIADTLDTLHEQKAELETKLKAAEARIKELESAQPQGGAPAAGGVNATEAFSVLASANKVYEDAVAEGNAESERLITDAKQKSKKIIEDAEKQRNSTLAKLEQERTVLESKISTLSQTENDSRQRMKSFLQDLLNKIDSTM